MTNPLRSLPRRDRCRELRRLVPTEVAAAHERVRAAARRPGIAEPDAAVSLADDLLLEVAALLAGRPPKGLGQEQLVASRTAYLEELATSLDERGDAWQLALAELDEQWPVDVVAAESPPQQDRVLVSVLVVALSPFLLGWDLVRGVGRSVLPTAAGIRRGVVAAWSATGRLATEVGRSVTTAVRRWRTYRERIGDAWREARARVIAARLRVRLRLRRLRAAR